MVSSVTNKAWHELHAPQQWPSLLADVTAASRRQSGDSYHRARQFGSHHFASRTWKTACDDSGPTRGWDGIARVRLTARFLSLWHRVSNTTALWLCTESHEGKTNEEIGATDQRPERRLGRLSGSRRPAVVRGCVTIQLRVRGCMCAHTAPVGCERYRLLCFFPCVPRSRTWPCCEPAPIQPLALSEVRWLVLGDVLRSCGSSWRL
jgi:hypothetical protein